MILTQRDSGRLHLRRRKDTHCLSLGRGLDPEDYRITTRFCLLHLTSAEYWQQDEYELQRRAHWITSNFCARYRFATSEELRDREARSWNPSLVASKLKHDIAPYTIQEGRET